MLRLICMQISSVEGLIFGCKLYRGLIKPKRDFLLSARLLAQKSLGVVGGVRFLRDFQSHTLVGSSKYVRVRVTCVGLKENGALSRNRAIKQGLCKSDLFFWKSRKSRFWRAF